MKFENFKYTLGVVGTPSIIFIALYFNGFWSFFSPLIAFVLIPILDLILPKNKSNQIEIESSKLKNRFFDFLLYLNIPIQYGLLFYFLYVVTYHDLSAVELIGKTISMGLGCSILGINVAHELGHRDKKYEQFMAKCLLLTSLYMHFFIEHNRGHHKNVSTPMDATSSKLNEPVFIFWFRSVFKCYVSAFKLEKIRLNRIGLKAFTLKNEMIQFIIVEVLFIAFLGIIFNTWAILYFISASTLGFILLETVNYIEHYGLVRKEIEPGIFEKVKPKHSWNSEHALGRIMLYELTRHSDHHFKATRKYQFLKHIDESPQLPYGYPTSIALCMIPPLWFYIMNPRVEKINSENTKPLPI